MNNLYNVASGLFPEQIYRQRICSSLGKCAQGPPNRLSQSLLLVALLLDAASSISRRMALPELDAERELVRTTARGKQAHGAMESDRAVGSSRRNDRYAHV